VTKPPDPLQLELPDEAATEALARRIAAAAQPGDLIALRGALGMGKTVFARAFIRALADPDEEVPSPTFTLVQHYETDDGTIWHFDLYRLRDPVDAFELGFEEAHTGLATLIEWPERLGSLLPRRRLDLTLAEGTDPGARRAELKSVGGDTLLARFQALA
jgi:tRNA threonylcarbamoyladenosine biosynthesis protein TsaE